ncbi:MAG: mismatch-specific DNA-glycosylase [Pelosinus sp.]|nr:mismatch-specific DNA-glycosylase [Pelosinus sp.]
MLPDVLAEDLLVVFCGMAASPQSAKAKAYYAGPGNKFWPTLSQIGLTERQLKPHEFSEVLKYGIGLTDLAKEVSGRDAELGYSDFDADGLRNRINYYCPKVLCFNGKKAAQIFLEKRVAYGLQEECVGDTAIFVAPSTSGAASGFWDIRVWLELGQLTKKLQ